MIDNFNLLNNQVPVPMDTFNEEALISYTQCCGSGSGAFLSAGSDIRIWDKTKSSVVYSIFSKKILWPQNY
jgi:hypothetical protein